jgi:hypothetical protein
LREFPYSLFSPEPLTGEDGVSKDKDDLIAGEDRKLIPEGKYSAQCIEAKRGMIGQRTTKGTSARTLKIILKFRLIEGQFEGEDILMYINADYRPFPAGSKFYQSWVIASGRKPARRDRMTLDVFKNHIFVVGVKTVKPKFEDGTEKPEPFWYSRINEIYEKCA